jgi:exosome complex component RRP42
MDQAIREHIIKNLKDNQRNDGRTADQYREVSIEPGVSATADGSAKVTIGDTVIIAGVKLGLEKPYPDTPDRGNLMVNVELLPASSPNFEPGPPDIKAIEVARVIDRGIRESGMMDVKKLCVTSGESVWSVAIDICTINHAGNLLDAAHLAAVAAIQNARFPEVVDGVVDYKKKTNKKLPVAKMPISITVHKLGDHLLLDTLVQEEDNADGRLTVCSLEDGTICAMQKGGKKPFSLDEVNSMIDMALKQAKASRKFVA